MRISDWSSDVCSSDLLSCLSPNGGFENPIENLAHRSTRVGKPLVDHKHAACPPDVNSRATGTASEIKYSMTPEGDMIADAVDQLEAGGEGVGGRRDTSSWARSRTKPTESARQNTKTK